MTRREQNPRSQRKRRVHEPTTTVDTVPADGAGPCIAEPSHTQTRVYRIQGPDAHCVCDQCGRTWVIPSQKVETLAVFAFNLADSLDAAARINPPDRYGQPGVFIDDRTATGIANTLRRLATCD